MRPAIAPSLLILLALLCGPAEAQPQAATVVQKESVRFEYARVLKVTPVYQTLNASRLEQRCDGDAPADADTQLSRVVGAVKHVLSHDATEGTKVASAGPATARNCRMVQVDRQFRRPIAYDVDYTHRGANYRSRMPDDPGSLLRIRVSVMPVP